MAKSNNIAVNYQNVLGGVDLFRFIASLLVVVIHTHPFANTISDYYVTSTCRIAVPFFFCVSSMFFWKKKSDILKYVKRMGILYLVWFIIELPYVYSRFFMSDRSLLFEVVIFIKQLLFSNTFGAAWYITASVQATLLIWYMNKKVSNTVMWIIAILLYALSCLFALHFGIIEGTPAATFMQYLSYVIPPANSFVVAVVYMLIGKHIAEHPCDFEFRWLFYIAIFALCGMGEVYVCRNTYAITDAFVALVPFTYYLVRTLSSIRFSFSPALCKYFRINSTLVYFLHAYILFWAMSVAKLEQGLELCFVVMASALLLSIIIFFLSNKYQVLKYLY